MPIHRRWTIASFRNRCAREHQTLAHFGALQLSWRDLIYIIFPFLSSINEVICHGIPDGRKLEEGDIINLGKPPPASRSTFLRWPGRSYPDVSLYYKGKYRTGYWSRWSLLSWFRLPWRSECYVSRWRNIGGFQTLDTNDKRSAGRCDSHVQTGRVVQGYREHHVCDV